MLPLGEGDENIPPNCAGWEGQRQWQWHRETKDLGDENWHEVILVVDMICANGMGVGMRLVKSWL
jgi:hypothetical protein